MWKRLDRKAKALISIALLGTVLMLLLGAVPILSCPACFEWVETYLDDLHCNLCNNRRTVTLLAHWRWQWSASH